MRWIGQHIWSLISRFRNDVYFEDLDASSGTSALVVDAQGKVHINTGLTTVGGSEYVSLPVRFEEAVSKGDPVYISGYHGSVGPVLVAKADASNASHMPAFGLADANYTQNSTGHAISIGNLQDIDTSSYSIGDTLYVASGGGLTDQKPTGTDLIQNVATVSRSNANNGQLEVVATGRTNDVPSPLYVDHANQRIGVGITNPSVDLHVDGDTIITGDLTVNGTITPNQDKHYTHNQSISSNQWIISHDLNKYPSVQVIDSAGNFCIGQVTHNSVNQLTLNFNSSFGGKAYLN